MRVLNAVVVTKPARAMQMAQFQLIECRTVRGEPVRRDGFWLNRLIAQKTSDQLQSRLCVPLALDNDV